MEGITSAVNLTSSLLNVSRLSADDLGRSAKEALGIDIVAPTDLQRSEQVMSKSPVVSISTYEPPVAARVTETLALYEPMPTEERIRFSNTSENPLNQDLEKSLSGFNDNTQWSRNALALGSLVRSGATEYSQHAERSIASKQFELGDLNIDERTSLGASTQTELKLQLVTGDGDRVNFSFSLQSGSALLEGGESYGYQEIIIDFNVEGELSEEEREAISDFSKQLRNFSEGFFANPENEPDLSALKLFQNDNIADISLSLNGSDANLQLSASDTETERKISVSWVTDESSWESGERAGRAENSLELLLSKHGATEGSNIKQDLALIQQQAIIRESLEEGRATSQQQNNIGDAFAALHHDLYFLPPRGQDEMVTGLADYDLSFQGSVELPMQSTKILDSPVDNTANNLRNNQNSRLSEGIEQFSLSQTTDITEIGQDMTIRQQQDLSLDAAYFSPLAHLYKPDFSHQSFIHTSIKNESSIVSEQRFEGLDLVAATVVQQQDKNTVRAEYNEGKLISSTPREYVSSKLIDATELLQDNQDEQLGLQLVDELFFSKAFEH